MKKNAPKARGLLFWVITFGLLFLLFNLIQDSMNAKKRKLSFSEFMEKVENNRIQTARISGNSVSGKMEPEETTGFDNYETNIPLDYPEFISILRQHKVEIEVEKLSKNEWLTMLLTWAPLLIIIFFWISILRQQGGNKAFSFGKSRARMFQADKNKVTFKDVAGVDEAKEELQEIVEFLKDAKKFQRLGGKIPKGVLLVGPPGTGKTLLAKAIAGEANVPFFTISGSDFVELFVGVGASRVRDLFDVAKTHSPCIIFIDEIDAVGRQRGAGLGGGHDEREQTLNQLLVEMDGFSPNENIIVVAATNRPDILDTALLRPGRFDRRIYVSTPDVKGREEIFKVHTRKVPLAADVDLSVLARSTPGFTGADIANLVNEAALFASKQGKKELEMSDFEYAKDKVLMGRERKSMLISEEEKKITAYHEAGHALIAALEKNADPLHKVSIIPRGMALGVTQQLPLTDKYTYSRDYLEAELAVLLGGRISEELYLKTLTTGAGNDLERATNLARRMVCEWGMSNLGPISFKERDDLVFLGKDLVSHHSFSEETAKKIDQEVEKIILSSYQRAREILVANEEKLLAIVNALLERETLSSADIEKLLNIELNNKNETEQTDQQKAEEPITAG